jgi:hypothetical protein
MGERRGAYRILVKKLEGRRPLGKHKRIWEDTIKMTREEMGRRGRDWIDLAQDKDTWRAVVNAVMSFRIR